MSSAALESDDVDELDDEDEDELGIFWVCCFIRQTDIDGVICIYLKGSELDRVNHMKTHHVINK